MSFLQYVMLYLLVGAIVGFCFEIIMNKTDMNEDTTLGERIAWIALWPIFVIIFIWGMYGNDK